ncbi:MAG: SUMF1/EgtB/PvdO family nonheme iron enzyme [Candidatus Handelsmanbacteria bacterium]|nr:SUMF1/EgtB/PvdO family nonheme iron enzyme [Candidatus Handelsmanbacteria bacterium]
MKRIMLLLLAALFLQRAAQAAPPDSAMAAIGTAFALDRHEVTNSQYAAFLNEKGNQREGRTLWLELGTRFSLIEMQEGRFVPKAGFDNHPVIEVSWEGARAYCQWAGKRLPTEQEWHRACAGTGGWSYPWGEEDAEGRANLFGDKDGYARTAPGGRFPAGASPEGVMDLAGNVWEWTAADSAAAAHLRGGSWVNGKSMAKCTARAAVSSDHSYVKSNSLGFRCARSLP